MKRQTLIQIASYIACAVAGVAAAALALRLDPAFQNTNQLAKPNSQSPASTLTQLELKGQNEAPVLPMQPPVQLSALSLKKSQNSFDDSDKKSASALAVEGAHWAGCEGSVAKSFTESFFSEYPNSKAGTPLTLAGARLQILRSFPTSEVEGMERDEDENTASPDSQEGLTDVSRCRLLGKVYGQVTQLVASFDFASPDCGDNLKRWGVLMADVQCRTAGLQPSLDPLPVLVRARMDSCKPVEAENCLASFDARMQNLGEKCGIDATTRASAKALFTRARSCFFQ